MAGDAAVSASLLPALEGAAEPAQLSAPALPSTARAVAAAPHRAAAVGGKAATVLPVAVGEVDKRAVREAAARSPAVDASLAVEQEAPEVAEAELAEEAARARAAAATDSQGASTPSAGSRGPVLSVAVTAADRQASREAAARSPAVDASLAAEQEAPEVGEAELAAAKAAQPEGLDATPEYLAERAEARGQSGLGMGSRLAGSEEAEVAGSGSEQGPSGRLRMKVGLAACLGLSARGREGSYKSFALLPQKLLAMAQRTPCNGASFVRQAAPVASTAACCVEVPVAGATLPPPAGHLRPRRWHLQDDPAGANRHQG